LAVANAHHAHELQLRPFESAQRTGWGTITRQNFRWGLEWISFHDEYATSGPALSLGCFCFRSQGSGSPLLAWRHVLDSHRLSCARCSRTRRTSRTTWSGRRTGWGLVRGCPLLSGHDRIRFGMGG
jgi:hypothetical protein